VVVKKNSPIIITLDEKNISEFLADMQKQLNMPTSATDEGDCFVLKFKENKNSNIGFSLSKGVKIDISEIVEFLKEVRRSN